MQLIVRTVTRMTTNIERFFSTISRIRNSYCTSRQWGPNLRIDDNREQIQHPTFPESAEFKHIQQQLQVAVFLPQECSACYYTSLFLVAISREYIDRLMRGIELPCLALRIWLY